MSDSPWVIRVSQLVRITHPSTDAVLELMSEERPRPSVGSRATPLPETHHSNFPTKKSQFLPIMKAQAPERQSFCPVLLACFALASNFEDVAGQSASPDRTMSLSSIRQRGSRLLLMDDLLAHPFTLPHTWTLLQLFHAPDAFPSVQASHPFLWEERPFIGRSTLPTHLDTHLSTSAGSGVSK